MRRVFVLLAVLAISLSAIADTRPDFETVLLPISLVKNLPGAFGSVWNVNE